MSQEYLTNMCSFSKQILVSTFCSLKHELICIKDGGRWTRLMSSDLSHLSEVNVEHSNVKIGTHFSAKKLLDYAPQPKTISEKS